jgi:hypothetical protein
LGSSPGCLCLNNPNIYNVDMRQPSELPQHI